MNQKKTCHKCRALTHWPTRMYKCGLGYRLVNIPVKQDVTRPAPVEPCPKPKTWQALEDIERQEEGK